MRKFARRRHSHPPLEGEGRPGAGRVGVPSHSRNAPSPPSPPGGGGAAARWQQGATMHDVPGQTHWHEPTGGKRAGFGKFGRPKTPYDIFMESEGIPVFRDIGISKVQNLPLAPWKRTGGRGTYIQLTAPKANGAATSSRCRARARSIPRSISTRRSTSSSRAAAPPRSGSTTTTSATCSNGRRARCSRSRSTRCTASSMPSRRRRCCSPAPPRRT